MDQNEAELVDRLIRWPVGQGKQPRARGHMGAWAGWPYESIEYGVWVIAALQVTGGGSGWQVAGRKVEVAICDFKGRGRADSPGQPWGSGTRRTRHRRVPATMQRMRCHRIPTQGGRIHASLYVVIDSA